MKRILVVDDEPAILTLLTYHLEKEGYQVDQSEDGRAGLRMALEKNYDFIILDLMLPSLDGLEICRQLRLAKNTTPIIMLTAKDDEVDKILGLELGADDYLTKPFSPRELLTRIKVVLRRTSSDSNLDNEQSFSADDLLIDNERHEVKKAGQKIELTPKEYELLLYLIKRSGKTVSRDRLLEVIWGYDYYGETRLVDVHIGKLREKIEEDTRSPRYIKTVRGYGYKFEVNPE